jgi:hypothetical protein
MFFINVVISGRSERVLCEAVVFVVTLDVSANSIHILTLLSRSGDTHHRRPRSGVQYGSCVIRSFDLDLWPGLEDWQIPLLNIGLIVPFACIAHAVSRLVTQHVTNIPNGQ